MSMSIRQTVTRRLKKMNYDNPIQDGQLEIDFELVFKVGEKGRVVVN